MYLNLVQLIFSYLLALFIIREGILMRRDNNRDKRCKQLSIVFFIIGIITPVVTSVIFIERYL